MWTNKLNGEKKRHAKREKYTLYNISEKKIILNPWVLHWLCISHPGPWGGRGQGPHGLKQWDGGGKKKSQEGDTACARRERREGRRVWVCVHRHSEMTGSSFQTPVQAIEWVSSVRESDTELSRVFFKYSIVRKSPHLILSVWSAGAARPELTMRRGDEEEEEEAMPPPHLRWHDQLHQLAVSEWNTELLTKAPRKAASKKRHYKIKMKTLK